MILKQKNDSGQKNSNGSDIFLSYVRPFAFLNVISMEGVDQD